MICILDTSILCELLQVPGKSQDTQACMEAFRRRQAEGYQFIMPLASILETGNHIGQAVSRRHIVATRFAKLVRSSLDGTAPFVVHPIPDEPTWHALLERFPAWAAAGSGLGDLTIVHVCESLRQRFPDRRIEVWSKDSDLAAYSG